MKTPQQLAACACHMTCALQRQKGHMVQAHAPQCSAQVHAPPIPSDPSALLLVSCLSSPLETGMMVLASVEAQQCIQAGCMVPPFQGFSLSLFWVTGRSACVVEGACPEGGLCAQRQGIHPVPVPLQALLQMPVLQEYLISNHSATHQDLGTRSQCTVHLIVGQQYSWP